MLFYIFTTSDPLQILEVFRTLVAYGSDICPDWLFLFNCIQNMCRVVMAQGTTEFSIVSSVEHWSAEPFLKARVGFLIGTQFFFLSNTLVIRLTTFSFQFLVALFTEHPAAKPGDLRFNFESWRKTRILLRLDLPLATSIYFLFPFPLSKSLKNCYFGNFSIKKFTGSKYQL